MNDKILVTYASRTGSTRDVAEAIGKTLEKCGAQVDVLPMQEVSDVTPYRAVVAGSAIRGNKWLPEAMQFVRTHQAVLSEKPCAIFMVCITLAMKGAEKYRDGVAKWMDPVRSLVRPVSEGMFAGMLDFKKLPFTLDTLQLRLVTALGIFPKGDHRDWNAIHTWAESLSPKLLR